MSTLTAAQESTVQRAIVWAKRPTPSVTEPVATGSAPAAATSDDVRVQELIRKSFVGAYRVLSRTVPRHGVEEQFAVAGLLMYWIQRAASPSRK